MLVSGKMVDTGFVADTWADRTGRAKEGVGAWTDVEGRVGKFAVDIAGTAEGRIPGLASTFGRFFFFLTGSPVGNTTVDDGFAISAAEFLTPGTALLATVKETAVFASE